MPPLPSPLSIPWQQRECRETKRSLSWIFEPVVGPNQRSFIRLTLADVRTCGPCSKWINEPADYKHVNRSKREFVRSDRTYRSRRGCPGEADRRETICSTRGSWTPSEHSSWSFAPRAWTCLQQQNGALEASPHHLKTFEFPLRLSVTLQTKSDLSPRYHQPRFLAHALLTVMHHICLWLKHSHGAAMTEPYTSSLGGKHPVA